MDKQLLNALDNLSIALEKIAELLEKKGESAKSDVTKALQSGNFIEEIKEINIGVKSIKKDTQEILKQQKTILELSKKKESDKKTEAFESDPKKESSIKKGVASILLIAVAVLAIGLAFKLVGKVDFLSVIGLGIAIVLIAKAFEKISMLKMSLKEAAIAAATMVFIAAGIALSSFFLSMVRVVSFGQLLTSILIGAGMALILPSIGKLIQNMKGMSIAQMVVSALLLPLILPAVALGIALSSYAFSFVQPISFSSFLSSIMIGLIFVVLSFGLKKMMKAFGDINPGKAVIAAFVLPIVFTALSVAIWLSSKALSRVLPISFTNFLSSIMIAVLFVILAYAVKPIIDSISKMKWGDIPKIPILFTILSLAIAASAFILFHAQKYIAGLDFMTMLKILVFTIVLGIAVVVLSLVSWLVNKLGKVGDYIRASMSIVILATTIVLVSKILEFGKYKVFPGLVWLFFTAVNIAVYAILSFILNKIQGTKDYVKGGLSIVIMATTIMLTSLILTKGKYNNYPSLKWSIFTALGLAAFAVVSWLVNKLGGVTTFVKGGLIILILAAVILATSLILNAGKYKVYPSLQWVMGVGLGLTVFSLAAAALGLAVFGPQALIFAAGLAAILVVAGAIMTTSKILAQGKYDVKGFSSWAITVGLLFAVFIPTIIALGAIGMAGKLLSLLGAGDPIEVGTEAIKSIAQAIVDTSFILAKGSYKGGPTIEWASGIAIALGAFSPIYGMLMANGVMKIFGGGGVGPDDFASAIMTISSSIITAAQFFAMNKAAFLNPPPVEWAEGVGMAIGAFAPVFKVLQEGKSWFGDSGPQDVQSMKNAILTISEGIVTAAFYFAKNKSLFTDNYPSVEWGEGVGAALGAFAPVFSALQEEGFDESEEVVGGMKNAIITIASAIVTTAQILNGYTLKAGVLIPGKNKPDFNHYPNKEWGDAIGTTVIKFNSIFGLLSKQKGGIAGFTLSAALMNAMFTSVTNISVMIKKNESAFKATIPTTWIGNLSVTAIGYANLVKKLESLLTTTEKKTTVAGLSGLLSGRLTEQVTVRKETDVGIVTRTVASLVQTAKILHAGRKFFDMKIDPNYMKYVGSNILAFAYLTQQLSRVQQAGGIGGMFRKMMFQDPISQMADGMVRIAAAYDILARSLQRFGDSLSTIDGQKVSLLRKLTGNLAVLSVMDAEMFSKMLSVLESKSSMFSKLVSSDINERGKISVGDRGKEKSSAAVSNKITKVDKKEVTDQLEDVIKILKQISYNTSGLDEWLSNQGFKADEKVKL